MFGELYFYYVVLLIGLIILVIILNPFKKKKNLTSETVGTEEKPIKEERSNVPEYHEENLPIGKITGERYQKILLKIEQTKEINKEVLIEESEFEDDRTNEHLESIDKFFENFTSGIPGENVEITIVSNNPEDYVESLEEIESLNLQKKAVEIINEKNEIEDFFQQAEKNVRQNKEIFEQFGKILKDDPDNQ